MSVTTAEPLAGPMVWRGEDLARSTDWIRAVTPAEVDELDGALRAVQQRGLTWPKMSREDFPIPRLAASLGEVARELEDGRGLVLLRGIPVARYTDDELRIAYWGLGLHLGTPRYQNGNGELIGDVRDENRLYGAVREVNPMQAGEPRTSRNKARSAGPLRFHTDRVDVVTLLCVRPALTGGLSKVVSSAAVYNTVLRKRPDLHALLCAPYYHVREGEAGGKQQYYTMPVFGLSSSCLGFLRSLAGRGCVVQPGTMIQQLKNIDNIFVIILNIIWIMRYDIASITGPNKPFPKGEL